MEEQRIIPINLESLIDLSAKLNETYDEDFILNAALLSLMGKLRIFRACILKPEACDGETPTCYVMKISKGRQKIEKAPYFPIDKFRPFNILNEGEEILLKAGYKHCIPIKYRDSLLAALCLGGGGQGDTFTDEEYYYVHLVSVIAASAMQNAKNYTSLKTAKVNAEKRNQLLTTLFEVGREFSSLLSKNEIVKMLSYRLMGQLMVSRFAVYLIKPDGKPDQIINRFDTILPELVVKELATFSKTELIEKSGISEELKVFTDDIKAKVMSPMIVQGNPKGFLIIGRKMNKEEFSPENLLFIEALGNTAIAALENERLFHEELQRKKLENELSLAMDIQKNLLPKTIPDVIGFEMAGISIPSQQVGGDYFDFIALPDGGILIAIADVSGKGMSAALLMANVQATLRALSPLGLSLKEMISRINNIIFKNTSSDRFITFFFGILDPITKSFKYLNAGHNPPFLIKKDGSFGTLTEGGIILGIFEEASPYEEGEVSIENDDVLLLYTDGITEAQDKEGSEFGEENLKSELSFYKSLEAGEIMEKITGRINEYSRGAQQTDDITLIVLKGNDDK